jgi:2-(1,2-epoxy-1,2-dihydrophenyl)acetyl-CoA isomerase
MAKAKELTLLAELISAEVALAMGLVNWVVPVDSLHDRSDELIEKLRGAATLALRRSTTLLDDSVTRSLAEALEAEAHAQVESFESVDTREAAIAFFEKRPARFIGE